MDHFTKKIRYLSGMLMLSCALFFFTDVEGSNPDSTLVKPAGSLTISSQSMDSGLIKPFFPAGAFIKNPIPGIMTDEGSIRAGLLYDMERKVIVWEKDMNYAYPVASLTKMMVALLAIEDIKAGKANWNDEVTVTRFYYKGSRRHKKKYSVQVKYTLNDLIRLAMISSNNEATVWIGKQLSGGTLEPFIRRMNEKCMALGMEHTFFSNPSGLPAVSGELDNSSSPHDLLVLALELIRHQEILDITKIDYCTIDSENKNHSYRNHNGLVIQYPNEVDGLKTGYTKNARFCLVATASRSGHRLVSIVLGAKSPYFRNDLVADMMNNYFGLLGLGQLGALPVDSTMARLVTDSLGRYPATLSVEQLYSGRSNENPGYRKVYVKTKKTHIVKKGETLYGIADKYKCFASNIKKWNRLKSGQLKAGQRLIVYQTIEKTVAITPDNRDSVLVSVQTQITKQDSAKAKVKPKSNPKQEVHNDSIKSKFVYHIVQPGDTLWNIAQRYSGTTVEKIKKVNKIHNSKTLKPGTKLKIQLVS